jgi:hypothetical protein
VTVQELREALKDAPDDAKVIVINYHGAWDISEFANYDGRNLVGLHFTPEGRIRPLPRR